MGTVFCDKCGASLDETAKFCRICGESTPVTEAVTKRFDEGQQTHATTNPGGSPTTTPQYMPQYDVPMIAPASDLKEKSNKRLVVALVAMLAFMALALGGLLIFLNANTGPPAVPPSTPSASGGRPGGGPVPGGIPKPSVPPTPPEPPVGVHIGNAQLDPSLKYPGSQVVTAIREGSAGVFTLITDDPVSKVSDWYIAKLNLDQKVVAPGKTVLTAGETVVTITSRRGGASIVIASGGR